MNNANYFKMNTFINNLIIMASLISIQQPTHKKLHKHCFESKQASLDVTPAKCMPPPLQVNWFGHDLDL